MTNSVQTYSHHLDDAWLMVVAQRQLLNQREVFVLLVMAGKCEGSPAGRRKFEHTLRHLHRKGHLVRDKIGNLYHYAYADECILRPVTGDRFTKALELGLWTAKS